MSPVRLAIHVDFIVEIYAGDQRGGKVYRVLGLRLLSKRTLAVLRPHRLPVAGRYAIQRAPLVMNPPAARPCTSLAPKASFVPVKCIPSTIRPSPVRPTEACQPARSPFKLGEKVQQSA